MSQFSMTALLSLISIFLGIYIIIVIMRLFLQTVGASYHNPIIQAIIKLTDPPLKPLRRFIPGFKGVDVAALVLLFVLELIKVLVIVGFKLQTVPDVGGWTLWAVSYMLDDIGDVLFFSAAF